MNKQILELKEAIEHAENIVFFGGAGVSTESGLKDFRSKEGLYNLHSKYGEDYETMLSSSYFYEHIQTFYQFYREFMINLDALPNYAHFYLAKLQERKNVTIVTQNIDNLHQVAGSKKIIELHGNNTRYYCLICHRKYTLKDILKMPNVPLCPKCHGLIKPDVVLYEEPLNEGAIEEAIEAIKKADLLIVAGTSLRVFPAAALIKYFQKDNIFVINKETLLINQPIKEQINRNISEVFKLVS